MTSRFEPQIALTSSDLELEAAWFCGVECITVMLPGYVNLEILDLDNLFASPLSFCQYQLLVCREYLERS